MLDSALSFIKKLSFPELILFGVTKESELEAILNSWKDIKISNNQINYDLYSWENPKEIDPRNWEIKK